MTIEQIKSRLVSAYPDATVEVEDLTGTSDHIQVFIETVKFKGMSLLERHRQVMGLFDQELKSGEVHALTIKAKVKE